MENIKSLYGNEKIYSSFFGQFFYINPQEQKSSVEEIWSSIEHIFGIYFSIIFENFPDTFLISPHIYEMIKFLGDKIFTYNMGFSPIDDLGYPVLFLNPVPKSNLLIEIYYKILLKT